MNMSVCFSACLSASVSPELHAQSSPKFLRLLLIAVARSFSGCDVIRYVFPVLWMTYFLKIMANGQREQKIGIH